MTLADAIGICLRRHGVDRLFCVLGDGNLELLARLKHAHGIGLVHCRHEQAAVAMAHGHAHFSAHAAVASVTHGPGLANAATALVAASKDRVPVVVLTSILSDPGHVQYFRQSGFVESCGATNAPSATASELLHSLDSALSLIGPKMLVVAPLADAFGQFVTPPSVEHAAISIPPAEPEVTAITAAAYSMSRSKRPIVLAGRGAVEANADSVLQRLAATLGAPIVTTLPAKGLCSRYRLSAGVCGALGSRVASELLAASDCVYAVGSSLNSWTTSHGDWVAGKQVIHVDVDHNILANSSAELKLHGDARIVSTRLLNRLPRSQSSWPRRLLDRIYSAQRIPILLDGPGTVDPQRALISLNEALPSRRALVIDGGHFAIFANQLLAVRDPRLFAVTYSFGAIGQALPVALGAAFALRGRLLTVAVVGDGGLMMALPDLDTAARYALRVLVWVMNDEGYGQERHALAAHNLAPNEADYPSPDLVAVARAMGLDAHRIDSIESLAHVARLITKISRPTLVDVRVNPNVVHPLQQFMADRPSGPQSPA